MKPAKSIGVVGMAVPYSSVRTGNTYVTSWNDFVIDATRLPTLNNILNPNVSIPYQPSIDKLGHNLRATYLAHTVAGGARAMMVSRITSEFNGLKTTTPTDPGFPIYPHASTQWTDCNIAVTPWGCFDGVGTTYYAPFIHYWVPGGNGYTMTTTGSFDQAVTMAATNANACQAKAESENSPRQPRSGRKARAPSL